MSIAKIIEGIKSSPLEEDVIKKAIDEVNKKSQRLGHVLSKLPYVAPESPIIWSVADEVLDMISPILASQKVPAPNGRDTHRHIYASLGGSDPIEYDVQK